MHAASAKGTNRPRGSVLIFVLGMVLFVSALLTGFIVRTGDDLVVTARASDESRLRRDAYSAMETTLAVLAEFVATDGGLHAPEQGWQEPLAYAGWSPSGGVQVTVSFEDETGKLSLPTATRASLRVVFEASGLDAAKAEAAAGALIDWMRPDADGFARGPGRPLRSYAELALVEGLGELVTDADGRPNAVWRGFEAAVSLHEFGSINLNSAAPAALRALGWSPRETESLLQARMAAKARGAFATSADMLLMVSVSTGNPGARIEALRITVGARSGGLDYYLQAVVAPAGASPAGGAADSSGLRYPFRILEFHEDPDWIPEGRARA